MTAAHAARRATAELFRFFIRRLQFLFCLDFNNYSTCLFSIISINFLDACDKDTLFKKHTPIFLFGISSINCTSYNNPLFIYSWENSFVTHAIPKFIFANSNNKSCEPNSNSGEIFIPLDNHIILYILSRI